jgi:hypothetical protein
MPCKLNWVYFFVDLHCAPPGIYVTSFALGSFEYLLPIEGLQCCSYPWHVSRQDLVNHTILSKTVQNVLGGLQLHIS